MICLEHDTSFIRVVQEMMPQHTETPIQAGTTVKGRKGGGKSARSRAGCRTCKIRRIKCDEGRPACLRCSGTGRTCDGYGIWDTNRPVPSLTVGPLRPMPASEMFSRNKHAQSCFAWFTTRASKKIPGIFASDFWNTLVLQFSTQEPVVLNSLVALASAHKRGMLLSRGGHSEPDQPDMRESFMLQHYNAAIGQLRRYLIAGDKESVRVAAIACLIFICLEFMRGNIKTGASHLQNGLKLLPILNSQPDVDKGILVLKAHNESIDDALTEAFLRLHVYSASFHRRAQSVSIVVQDCAFGGQTKSFPTIEAAKQHLEELLNRIYRLEAEAGQLQSRPHPSPNPIPQEEQRRIQRDLECWLKLYKSSRAKLANGNSHASLSFQLLLIYHAMASVMAGTCLATAEELSYDLFNSTFASITTIAQHLWKSAASVMAADILYGACAETFSFSADMGIILPLYYTVLKCRCPRVRRRALKLLEPASHQEGIWNGHVAMLIARRVVEVEERDFYGCSPLDEWPAEDSTGAEADIPTLPESYRISDVYIEPFDNSSRGIVWVCRRMQATGKWKIVYETVRRPDAR